MGSGCRGWEKKTARRGCLRAVGGGEVAGLSKQMLRLGHDAGVAIIATSALIRPIVSFNRGGAAM